MRVGSAAELREAVLVAAAAADAVVMCAAVADFRPAVVVGTKIKKSDDDAGSAPLALARTADVLADLVASRHTGTGRPVIVGFAAETGDAAGTVLEHGRAKLVRKGCDLLVVNDVSGSTGFGSLDNAAVVLGADGSATAVPLGPKEALADTVWDLVGARWSSAGTG